jgi:hypothetical protein
LLKYSSNEEGQKYFCITKHPAGYSSAEVLPSVMVAHKTKIMNAGAITVFRNIAKRVKICFLAGLPNVKLRLNALILWAYTRIELFQLVFTYLSVTLVSQFRLAHQYLNSVHNNSCLSRCINTADSSVLHCVIIVRVNSIFGSIYATAVFTNY